jgi:hypothetical protein
VLKKFQEFPWLISVLGGSATADEKALGEMLVELRLKLIDASSSEASFKVLSARVAKSFEWNPAQPIVFEGLRGLVSLVKTDDGRGRLTGILAGFYRPPISEFTEWSRAGDFLWSPLLRATMEISLNISLMDPLAPVPLLNGSLTIQSDSLAKDFGGARRIVVAIARGNGRLYSHDLPARDAANEVDGVYLMQLVPLLVGETGNEVFSSVSTQLAGALRVWQQGCGIRIDVATLTRFIVDRPTVQNLNAGITSTLVKKIRTQGFPGPGVPVVFTQPKFAAGGGEADDFGLSRSVLLVTDQVGANDTVLAHEIGHALGGLEAGSSDLPPFWVGKNSTIMEGSGDVAKPDPPTAGDFACLNARRFALYRQIP